MKRFLLICIAAVWISNAAVSAQDAASKTTDPSGAWRLEFDWQGKHYADIYRLRLTDKGKLVGQLHRTGRDKPMKITNGTSKDGKVAFTVADETDGVQWTVDYEGTVTGDTIEGGLATVKYNDVERELPWQPKRSVLAEDVLGTWQIHVEMPNGDTFEPTFKITKQGDELAGQYISSQIGELDVESVSVEENQLKFTVSTDLDSSHLVVDYKGRPYGDKLSGMAHWEAGDNSGDIEFTAKRKNGKKK